MWVWEADNYHTAEAFRKPSTQSSNDQTFASLHPGTEEGHGRLKNQLMWRIKFAFRFQLLVTIFFTTDKKCNWACEIDLHINYFSMEVTWPRFCKNQRLGETSILLCTKIISLCCYFYPFKSINYLNKDLHLNDVCDLFYFAAKP